jgi:hypothetical protein
MEDDRRPTDADAAADGPAGEPPESVAAPAVPSGSETPPAVAWGTGTPPSPPAPPASAPGEPIVDWGGMPPEPGPWTFEQPAGWTGLDVTGLFARTIDTFLGHWPTFVVLSLPSVLISVLSIATTAAATTMPALTLPVLALYLFVAVYVTTSTIMAADDARAGRPVSVRNVLGRAVGRALISFVSALVVFLCLIGLFLLPTLFAGILASSDRSTSGAVIAIAILVILVFLVFIGLALYMLLRWSLAPAAIAIDNGGPLGGLRQSWKATRGNVWRISLIFLAIGLLTLPWSLASSLFSIGGNLAAGLAIGLIGALAFGALTPIVSCLAYGDITGRPRADVAAVEEAQPAEPGEGIYAADSAAAPDMTPGAASAAEAAVPEVSAAEPFATPDAGASALAEGSAEPAPPVAWPGEPVVDSGATASGSDIPTTPPKAPSRPARRVYAAGALVIGLVLLLPAVAVAVPAIRTISIGGFAGVPAVDRGKIYAGTQRNIANPCAPSARSTEFSTTDTIYIGGYFTRAILPGQSATIHVLVDDVELFSGPIEATTQMVGCYYELDPLVGLGAAEYHLIVDDAIGTLAEGTFVVR